MTLFYRTVRRIARTFCRIAFRLKIEGLENLHGLEGRGLILASNHLSFLDPPLVAVSFPWAIHFLAKKSLIENPIGRFLFPKLNVTGVDRDRPDLSAMREILRFARDGKTTLIFPEGTRSLDGLPRAAQPGIGMIIAKTGVPVVPVRIVGSFEAFPKSSKFMRFVPITVKFGPPLRFPDVTDRVKKEGRAVYQSMGEQVMTAIHQIA
jgi:1-acyl-sn-glycerol-3-phosphate acyltransferase